MEVRLFLKQTDCREEIDITEEIENGSERIHSLQAHHKWDYISNFICYLDEAAHEKRTKTRCA